MNNNTAKHFVLQLGSLISLYLSLTFLVVLAFGIINLLYPDATNLPYESESAVNSVRIGIAVLVVFFPTYLALTRLVNQSRRANAGGMYLTFTKWLLYLSLLVSGLVLLGDLVTVIMTFLNGEMTERFILKALTVLVVVGAAFHYYALDAKGFWLSHEDKSVLFGIGAAIVVFAAVAFGFTKIDTPTVVREQRIDTRQIDDLRTIQNAVQQYYFTNKALPDSLESIETNGMPLPTAPESRPAYRYSKTETGFELCATFTHEAQPGRYNDYYAVPVEKGMVLNAENWQHGAGEVCFKRTIEGVSN